MTPTPHNWRSIVSENNTKQHQWPAGWDTKETVATALDCTAGRVKDVLAPAIKAGTVEHRSFKVWDAITERFMTVVGYRQRFVITNGSESDVPATAKPRDSKGSRASRRVLTHVVPADLPEWVAVKKKVLDTRNNIAAVITSVTTTFVAIKYSLPGAGRTIRIRTSSVVKGRLSPL